MASDAKYSASFSAGGYDNTDWDANASESILGGIGRAWNNITGNTANNLFNAQEAQKQREHELYMSNTAYQRATEDMRKAGINPASLTQGSMTPASGSSSSAASSGSGSGAGIIGGLVSAVVQLALGKKRLDIQKDLGMKKRYTHTTTIKRRNGTITKSLEW